MHRSHSRVALFASIFLAFLVGRADTLEVVIPSALTNTEGSGSSTFPFANGDRTIQMQIASSTLGLTTGDQITGFTFRLDGASSSSPASNFTTYKIVLAKATNTISGMTTTFADNMTAPQTARNGSLSLSAGAFPGGSTPNAFGSYLNFDTPYTYQGGDLVVYLTHTAASGLIPAVDAVLTTDSPSGYGTAFRALSATSLDETTSNSPAHFPILKFNITPIPEPSSDLLAIFATGALSWGSVRKATAQRIRRAFARS